MLPKSKDEEVITYPTGKGKKLQIVSVANSSLYAVQFTSGGELPEVLKNKKWTTPQLAEKDILKYLEEKNGSGTSH